MKKIFSLVLLITLFMTGCGNKGPQVECSSKTTINGMTIEQQYILSYDDNNITKIEVNRSYAFEDSKRYEDFGNVIDNNVSNMKSMENDHIKFSNREKDKTYTTKLEVEMEKVTDYELSILGFSKNLSDFKQRIEGQGLVCKK